MRAVGKALERPMRQEVLETPAHASARHAQEPLLTRVWALRQNLTACDAVYVALAEVLDATLLTCDARLSGAPGVEGLVDLVQLG